MEMQQIRYFLALCETQNFTQAATRCGVSQPSLTNGIGSLERELGGNLFHRGGRKTKLSPLGAAVQPYLRQIVWLAEKAKRETAIFLGAGTDSSCGTMEESLHKIKDDAAIAERQHVTI
jgi:LysR family hydrogen peroxide-inducible transcriptional activator